MQTKGIKMMQTLKMGAMHRICQNINFQIIFQAYIWVFQVLKSEMNWTHKETTSYSQTANNDYFRDFQSQRQMTQNNAEHIEKEHENIPFFWYFLF